MLEKTEGVAQSVAGHIQEAVGTVTGDDSTRAAGQARQAAGSLQQSYGDLLSQVRESAVSNPAATVAVIAGVGFVLGAIWAKR